MMNDIQKTCLTVYALTLVGSLLMMIPMGVLPFAGLACVIVGLGSAYIYRWRSSHGEMMHEHMAYIIRTIWWATLILFVGIGLFCSIIIANGDLSMVYDLMEQTEKGLIPTDADIRAMQYKFLDANSKIIGIAAFFGLLPYPLYLIYRLIRGVRRVIAKA